MRHVTSSPEETFELGRRIGSQLHGGERILLMGELGAGKTVLSKGIVAGAGSEAEVLSPTFVIERIYEGRFIIRHLDLYRLDARGIEGLGMDEIDKLDDLLLIEWGEKLPPSQRAGACEIRIDYDDTNESSRIISIDGIES